MSSINKILSKFDDGKTRYLSDPLVNQTVRALASGADPIKLLDQVITMHQKSVKEFKAHLLSVRPATIVNARN